MTPFETTTDLLPHQADAVAKVLPSRVAGLFMEMGTGKSRTAIELAHIRSGKIDRVVWACPVSLKETVRMEIRKHTDCRDVYVFGDKKPDLDARWVVVGIESLSSSNRTVLELRKLITDATMVIVDESTYIKGHDSIRTWRITKLSEQTRYRLILTGTPLSQGVVDLYAQMRFLSPKILGYRSWYSFSRNHLEYSEKFPGMIVRSLNTRYLAKRIRPYIYQVTKEECLDLPEKLYESFCCHLSDEQREWYYWARERAFQDMMDDEDFGSYHLFRLFTSLQSIVCGFWNRPQKTLLQVRRGEKQEYERMVFPESRTGLMMDIIKRIPSGEKIIIWAKFRYSIQRIVDELSKEYGPESVTQFHGGLREKERNDQVERFKRDARFFIGTQSCAGHGLTLNEASHVIFYANGFKYSERVQAEDRNHRIGQDKAVTYIDVYSNSGIDGRIMKALTKKGNALREFRDEVEKIKKKGTKEKIRKLVMSL